MPTSSTSKKSRLGRPWKRAVGRLVRGGRGESTDDYGSQAGISANEDNDISIRVHHHQQQDNESPDVAVVSQLLLPTENVVTTLERFLRHLVVILIAYCCGVWFPTSLPYVMRAIEYLSVAWITCIVLIVMTFIKGGGTDEQTYGELLPLLQQQQQQTNNNQAAILLDEQDNVESDDEDDIEAQSSLLNSRFEQPHPALEIFYMIDTATGQRCIPNSTKEPFVLENDLFSGRMVTLIRTPDVNDKTAPQGTLENSEHFVPYFSKKARRFEFQWQIRLKHKPQGKVYFACELEESVKMGMLQRAFVGAAMAFVKKMSTGFAYSIVGSDEERPHMAFCVETSMLRIIATKKGETPPTLGTDLVEDPEHLKRRMKTGVVDWNTEDTYTLAMWSSYFDFLDWKSMNFPAIKPFGLASVVGPQSIHLTMYVMPEGQDKHYRRYMEKCADLEISNSNEMNIGPAAKQWLVKHKKTSKSLFRDPNAFEGDNESMDEDLYLEERTIAELGGHLYLRSGDPVLLEVSSPDKDVDGFISNGGGFAVVQQNTSATVVLEKATNKKRHTDGSSLIRSGDAVMLKLLAKGVDDTTEVKYLSIHRGWWLKWVNHEPKNNGFFTLHTQDTETGDQETQSSYATMGGTFWLSHKRWNGYHVGVRTQESATYGGRMLGLYDFANKTEDDDHFDLGDGTEGTGGKWMKPLLFSAQAFTAAVTPRLEKDRSFSFDAADYHDPHSDLRLTTLNCSLDIPVWIEMMDRTERRRKLAYVVRVVVDNEGDEAPGVNTSSVFCRLRSGRTLAEIIRAGLGDHKKGELKTSSSESLKSKEQREIDCPVLEQSDSGETEAHSDLAKVPSSPQRNPPRQADAQLSPRQEDAYQIEPISEEAVDELTDDELEFPFDQAGITPKKQTKGRKIMDQIAKTVNFDQFARTVATSTAKTGKQVVKQGKKVQFLGVTAGKAIIAPVSRTATVIQHSKKPPTRDPKSGKAKQGARSKMLSKRRDEMDLLAVNRRMKRFDKKNSTKLLTDPHSLAGQLSPTEQSLRQTSHALNRISNAAPSSQMSKQFEDIANTHFRTPTELDRSFLQGGAFQLGVVPPDGQRLVYASLVARCLWESHWREEWIGVYERNIELFTPASKHPALQLSYFDISSVRALELDELSPLPGYPILAIETGWQCYYLAFPNEESRDEFCAAIQEQRRHHTQTEENKVADKDLWKARYLQGFQDSVGATVSSGNHKWAKIPSGTKTMHRSVMNVRRMAFDVEALASPDAEEEFELERIESFVSKLLELALSTTFDNIETNPETFAEFLDMASQLRSIPLDRLDLGLPASLCIFTNIYHCLLQHALLLTINGPLYKKSVGHFFRTTSYEIGADVFSLAELYHCVIRGNMSKPVSPKKPFIEIPRKSSSYNFYALVYTDSRINFVLNTGDVSCRQEVPVLRPSTLESQLQDAATIFVAQQLVVEEQKRVILLPKVCDIYRNDFSAGDSRSCLSFCASFLSADRRNEVVALMKDETPYAIKFVPCAEQYHQVLSSVLEEDEQMDRDVEAKAKT